jgi:hypothetical protein
MAGPAAKKPVRMESRDPAYDLMELTGKRPRVPTDDGLSDGSSGSPRGSASLSWR